MITECSIVTPVQKKWFAAVTHRRVSTDYLKDTLDKRNKTKEGLEVLFESNSFTQSTQYFIQFGCSFHQKHFSTVHQIYYRYYKERNIHMVQIQIQHSELQSTKFPTTVFHTAVLVFLSGELDVTLSKTRSTVADEISRLITRLWNYEHWLFNS